MKHLVDSYIEWIKQGLTIREINGGWHEIVTPFLNHKNDMIEIYIKQDGDQITLSDGGNTVNELRLNGLDIDKSKRRLEELNTILRSFGLKRSNNREIIANTDKRHFAETKHRLIQAILCIDDMFMLSEQRVKSFFIEDVANFFEMNEVVFMKDTLFTGKSGFTHKFDFALPKIKKRQEIAIRAINSPRKDIIGSALWNIEDTRLVRSNTEGLVILNDSNEIQPDIYSALDQYKVSYVNWSNRNEKLDIFRAAS